MTTEPENGAKDGWPRPGELWVERNDGVNPADADPEWRRVVMLAHERFEDPEPYVVLAYARPRGSALDERHRVFPLARFLEKFRPLHPFTEPQHSEADRDNARIMHLLALRYEPPQWAVFRELQVNPNGGGRRIDLFALSCWKSSGFHSIAVEVKVSRADFLRELRDPSKRADAERFAHECYFATPPGVAKVDEVPEGWGLLQAGEGGIRQVKAAQQRKPEAWPQSFMVSIVRRCADDGVELAQKRNWPKGVWAASGRVIAEDGLKDFASSVVHREIDAAVASVVRGFAEEQKAADPEIVRLRALHDAVGLRVFPNRWDRGNVTAEAFEAWATQARAAVDRRSIVGMRAAHKALSELLEHLEPTAAKGD